MVSRIAASLGALLLGAGTLATLSGSVTASAATAHPRPEARQGPAHSRAKPTAIADCPAGWACGFAVKDYGGGFGKWQHTNSNFNNLASGGDCNSATAGPFNTNGSWNDCISSAVNNLAGTIWYYPNSGCLGDNLEMLAGDTFANLANRMQNNGNSWDDVISADNTGANTTC